MPFAANSDLPADVRERHKGRCLSVFREVWNETFDRHGDEGRAWATAEQAAKNCEASMKATKAMMAMPDGMAAMRTHLAAEHGMDDVEDMTLAEMRRRHESMHDRNSDHDHPGMMGAAKSLAVKRVGPDTVEGLAIPYGIDTDGEQFTPDTDLCLDWFDGKKSGRPVIYDHGLEDPGPSVIGRQVEYEERPDGRWAQAQLHKHHRYRKAVDELIEQGALGFSSGAMPHLIKVNKRSGLIERWPWVELSLTPIPAHPGAMVHYAKSSDLIRTIEESGSDLTSFLKAALGAVLDDDRDGAPGTESLDDRAGRVSAALDEFRDHARSAVEMRAKAGRMLSAANRERISRVVGMRADMMAAFDELESMLAEAEPASKASDALRDALLEYEQIQARLLGVPIVT